MTDKSNDELQKAILKKDELKHAKARHFRCILCKQDIVLGDPVDKAPLCPRCSSKGTNVGTLVFNCTHPCATCGSVN